MKKSKSRQKSSTRSRRGKESVREDRTSINIGDISGGVGFAVGPGARAKVTQVEHKGADEIARVFDALQEKVGELPEGPEKSVAEQSIKAMEAEARKGEAASESSVRKWMRFLAEAAPDIWDVAVSTFMNPIKGVGTVFVKIASRARAEHDARNAQRTEED